MDELVMIRLKAHFDYMYPRLHDELKKEQFAWGYHCLLNGVKPASSSLAEGTKMIIDIYDEIVHIHNERFNGRTGDMYLEKL
jgi:hypothetical protein